jgi:hypothetical protein
LLGSLRHRAGLRLRAAMSLAQLGRTRGAAPRPATSSPVCNWFTDGFETADLKNARTLLDELAC